MGLQWWIMRKSMDLIDQLVAGYFKNTMYDTKDCDDVQCWCWAQ